MANVIYRGKSITFPDDMSEAEISQQMPLIADQIDVELESEAMPEEVAVPEDKGFFSKAADLYAERWQQGQDMVKSALGKYESVTEKAKPDETPSIERRGGPIKAEAFQGIKAQYEQLPPEQRERFLDKQGAIGNAFRNVDESYKATDATERKTDKRVESRQQRLLDDGLAPETARNIAQQGGDETTVSSIKAGVPDREVVDYALDAVRDIEKIGFTTGKMAVDTLRLSGEYIPVVGDMLIAGSDFASEKIAEIAQTQSPELQAKSFELQRLLQDGKRTQVTDFLAANPSVLVSTAIPSAGSIFLTAAPGVAIRGLGASAKLATNVTVSANAALNAGAAFSEAEGGPLEKYTAAFIAGAGSLAVGKLTEGGLEGAIARGNIGDAARSATGLRKVIKGAAEVGKVAGKEYLQEFGEGSSEALGVQTSEVMAGTRDGFSAQEVINQGQVEGAAGLLLGGGIAGVNVMLPKDRERNERQLKQQHADTALDSIQNAQSVDEAVGNALASIDTPIDAPISLETENVSEQIDATGLADATATPELDNQQGGVPVDVRAGGSGLIHEGRADSAGTLEPSDGIDLDAGIPDGRPDTAIAEGQVQAKVDIGSGVIVTSTGTPYKTERGAEVALKGKGLEGDYKVAPIGDGFGLVKVDNNQTGAGQPGTGDQQGNVAGISDGQQYSPVTNGMYIEVAGRRYDVDSLEQASAMRFKARKEAEKQGRTGNIDDIPVYSGNGSVLGYVGIGDSVYAEMNNPASRKLYDAPAEAANASTQSAPSGVTQQAPADIPASTAAASTNESAEQPDSLGAEIRPIVESIAKRRAAAQQINKEKAFDTALGLAKRMLAGEQVKPGQLQMAARQLKNDAELFDQVSKLVELAKAPAKAARAERAQSAEVYRSRISQAKTEEELQAIAAEIAKDAKLTDTQAADLDDAVMEAMDALDDSGSNDAEEKLAEQIADEVVAEAEADPSALEPKPGDSENEAYIKEQVNERIEQEDGKQAVADAEGQAEADIADGGEEGDQDAVTSTEPADLTAWPERFNSLPADVQKAMREILRLRAIYAGNDSGFAALTPDAIMRVYNDRLGNEGADAVNKMVLATVDAEKKRAKEHLENFARRKYQDTFNPSSYIKNFAVIKDSIKTGALDISSEPWAQDFYALFNIDVSKIKPKQTAQGLSALAQEYLTKFNAGVFDPPGPSRAILDKKERDAAWKAESEAYDEAARYFLEHELTAKPPAGKNAEYIDTSNLKEIDPAPIARKVKPAKDFAGMRDAIHQIAGNKDIRYYLNGIHFEGDIAVATDGHRAIAVSGIDTSAIPPKSDAEKSSTVLGRDGQWIDGTFPQWQRIIPEKHVGNPVEVDAKDISDKARGIARAIRFVSKNEFAYGMPVSVNGAVVYVKASYISDLADTFIALGYSKFTMSHDPEGVGPLYAESPDGKVRQVVMPLRDGAKLFVPYAAGSAQIADAKKEENKAALAIRQRQYRLKQAGVDQAQINKAVDEAMNGDFSLMDDLERIHGIAKTVQSSNAIEDDAQEAPTGEAAQSASQLDEQKQAIKEYGLPANTTFKQGKAVAAGKWMAEVDGISGSMEPTINDAANSLAQFIKARETRNALDKKKIELSKLVAEKIKSGVSPTDFELKELFGLEYHHDYVPLNAFGWFAVDYLGVPRNKIHESLGKAGGRRTSDFGAEYKIVYPRRLHEVFGEAAQAAKPDAVTENKEAPAQAQSAEVETIEQAQSDDVNTALDAINESDIPTAEKIRLSSELRKGEITPDDVKGVLNPVDNEQSKAELKPKSKASEKIEDVGEKMAGARKDMEIAARKEWSDEDLAAQPLSKIWPAGDIDAIEDTYVAAWAFASRAEIPSKPRKGYRLAAWVAKVKSLRLINAMALDGFLSKDKIQSKLNNFPALKDFDAKVRLLERLPREQWKRIGKVREYPNAYTYDASGVKIGKPQVTVEIDGRSNSYSGGTIDEAIDGIMERVGIAAPEKRMQFEVRGSGGKFHIYKKGDSKYHKLSEPFADPKDAFAFIKESYDELVAAWDGVKERENVKKTDVRGKGNKARTGEDWRKGKNVTPEQFAEQFGFRGIEFGNWVNQGQGNKDRQGMLNQAYDGLMDLASIIGIPPKAISLNGSLGLAFGSRGKGWAAAHFEPGNLVINLTKTKGAGSLAHEWFHALDNYFSRMRGGEVPIERGLNAQEAYRRQNFITYRPEPMYVHKSQPSKGMTAGNLRRYRELSKGSSYYAEENWQKDPKHPNGVRPEVESAFADVVEALDASPMNARAKNADKGKEGYWSQIIERAARSFENYVIHKMRLNGYDNEFLANVTSPENFPRNAEMYPYLLETEIQPIADAFDTLFSTIQTKETDTGVMMFSRSGTSAPIFYSQLSRGIDSAKFDTAPAGQWKLWLASNAGKLGVKKDEIQWTGITDWLELQTGKVSKADIQAYLDGNGVQVQDVMLSEENLPALPDGWQVERQPNGEYYLMDEDGEVVSEGVTERDAIENGIDPDELEDRRESAGKPKYAQYTVPGGKNYKELLLTLPAKNQVTEAEKAEIEKLGQRFNNELNFPAKDLARYNELRAKLANADSAKLYKSSHFDQPNILAHVRFDERTDADGNRVLFIQEVQSDWGQDGKKKGFKVNALSDAEQSELDKLLSTPMADMSQQQVNDMLYLQSKKKHEAGVPAAPFVTDTKAWVSLAIKRMMRYAAENGFDKVAFINGQQAADLYKLSNHIEFLEYEKNEDGTYNLEAPKKGGYGSALSEEDIPAEKLAGIIGKEVAQQIINGEGQARQPIDGGYRNWYRIEGDSLSVGDGGMKVFYDQIVPQVVNDVLKKVGGGKVETVAFGDSRMSYDETIEALKDREKYPDGSAEREALKATLETAPDYGRNELKGEQLGFTITPDMRDKIMSGLPLFGRQFSGSGMAVADVERAVNRIRAGWKNAPEIIVVDNMNDSRIRKAVRDENERQLSQGAQGQPEGFYDARKVYIVASELNSEKDVVRVLFHETLGHAGLRGVYGAELGKILDQVAMMRKKDIEAKAKQYGLDATNQADRRIAAEEVLAEMAQTNPQIGFVKRAIAAIRNFLRKHVPYFKNLELTDADIIQGYLLPARRFVQNGKKANDVRGMVAAFVRNYDDLYSAMLPNWGVKAEYQGETGVYNGARAIKNKFVALVMPEVVDHIHGLQGGGDRIVEFEIRETKHGDRIGSTTIEMRGNKPVALHDIAVDRQYRGQGYAKQVVGALLSAAPGRSMEIIEILDSAEGFWRKSGVHTIGYTDGNATLTWRDFAEANPEARGGKENQHGSFSRSASRGDAEASAYETADAGSEYVRQRPAVDQTKTPQFRAWFGDSVVTDNGKPMSEGGKPLVMYHATPNSFDVFNTALGSHFGSIDQANDILSFVESRRGTDGLNVVPVYLNIRNPKRVRDMGNNPLSWARQMAKWREEGYDGLVYKNKKEGGGGDSWVAFDREQIKSSIGNQGTFDPANPDIRFSRRPANVKQALEKAGINEAGFGERMRNMASRVFDPRNYSFRDIGDSLRQGYLDRFYGALRAERQTLGNLPPEQSPYVAMRLATGISSVMRGVLTHGMPKWTENRQHLEKAPDTKGLLEIIAPVSEDINDWLGWMVGNRAARLMQEGRENNFTKEDIAALRSLGKGKEATFLRVAKQFADFKRGILDVAEQAGLIDAETRPVWDHADWIPFYREVDGMVMGARNRKGLSHQNSGIRKLRGGDSALNDPLENIIMNFQHLLDASLKNNALMKAVDTLGEDAGITKVGLDMKAAIVPKTEVRKQLVASGVSETLIDALPENVFDGMAKMMSIVAPADKSVIRVMRNGKAEYYRVDDPLLLRAVTAFSTFDMPGLSTARAFKRLLTTTVTSVPEFWARNFVRDTASAKIIAKDGTKVTGAIRGIYKSMQEEGGFEQMLFAGASFAGGYIDGSDPEAAARAIRRALRAKGYSASSANEFISTIVDTPAKLFEMYQNVGNAVENANREAVFEVIAEKEGRMTKAAYESKDLMDFSLRGDSALVQLMADTIPFFNARLQGLYRLGRTDPKRAAMRAGLMLVLPSILLAAWNDDDERYKELADWDKDSYWHFWLNDEHYRIPKPFELGVLFATIPERITHVLLGSQSANSLGKRVAWNAMEQLNLVEMPQIIAPAAEVFFNYDTFRQSGIENMSDANRLPVDRYDERTSYTMRMLAQSMPDTANTVGASPKNLEHLFLGYTGTVGSYALALADTIARGIDNAAPTPEWRPDQYPVLKAFWRGSEPAFSTQHVQDIYEMARESNQILGSIRFAAQNGNDEEVDRLYEKYGSVLDVSKYLSNTVEYFSGSRKQVIEIQRDKTMTPKQKREAINELLAERNEIAREVAKEVKPAFGR